jgi:hypothetical protein
LNDAKELVSSVMQDLKGKN